MEGNLSNQPNRSTNGNWLRALILRDTARWSIRLGALMSWLKLIGRGQRRRLGRAAAGVFAGASGVALMALLAGPMTAPVAAAGEMTVDGVTCTLIDAIKAANTDAVVNGCDGTGSNTIILATDVGYSDSAGVYYTGNALPTVTSAVTITADSGTRTITLDNSSVTFRAVIVSGAAAHLTLENINITGGKATFGGGQIFAGGSASLTISGGTLSGGYAGGEGGSIFAEAARITVDGVTISDNAVAGRGGGIYLAPAGYLTLTDTDIVGNAAATTGGGIHAAGALTVTGSDIMSNTTGITGAGIYLGNTATISGTTISGNEAGQVGGGVYVGRSGDLTIANTGIVSNTAGTWGGGIGAYGPVSISGSTVESNTAGTSSGGIFAYSLTIADSNILNNSAADWGGGIGSFGTALISGSKIAGNAAATKGGGIYAAATMTITDTEIAGNAAATTGGGIHLAPTGYLTLTDTDVVGNTTGKHGGGIYSKGSVSVSGSTIESNAAAQRGGGVYSSSNQVLTITGTQILTNTAGTRGGGIYANGSGDLVVSNSTFSGNIATVGAGGGIFSGANVDLSVTGSVFSGNKTLAPGINWATGDVPRGAGIWAGRSRWSGGTDGTGVVTIDDTVFDGNNAKDTGSAMYTTRIASLTISDSSFTDNVSTRWTGGVSIWGHPATIENSTFTGNKVGQAAGAIYCGYQYYTKVVPSFVISNTTISGNQAKTGGAMYVRKCDTTIVNSTLSGNSAEKAGAIYQYGKTGQTGLSLINSTVADNSADDRGGAIFAYYGTHTIEGSILTGNTGPVSGHEIFNNKATVTVSNSVLGDSAKDTAAAFGGGVTFGTGNIFATSDGDEPTPMSSIVKPLADNGGRGTLPGGGNTKTHLLVGGSPAIDRILGDTCDVDIDQRGDTRPQGAGCDAGAIESGGGTINIVKLTTPAGLLDVFEFTSDITGSETFTLTHGLTETIDAPAGSFTVTESAAEGFTLDDISCTTGGTDDGTTATVAIGEGDEVTCTFTNSQDVGTLVIGKIISPTGLLDSFTFTVTDGAELNESFTLGDGETETLELPTGSFTVTEAVTNGFELIDVDCGEEPDRSGRIGGSNEVKVTVSKDETTTCTFTNEVIEDEDGVNPTTEGGAPNGGDGNGDGVPDYLQNHVTSLPNGEDEAYVSIAAADGIQMTDVSTGPAPADLPAGVRMPIGVISFTLKNLPSVGATVAVTLHMESPISTNTYYKLVNGVWTEYPNAEFVDSRTIVLTLTDGGAGDLDGVANGEIVDPSGPGIAAIPADIFISTWSAGKVGGLSYGPHDVLGYDSEAGEWDTWFAGVDAGLDPYRKWKHNLNAIWISDTEGAEVIFSLTQDNRIVPGISGIVDGMDLLRWDGDRLSLYFDGQDVGLNVKTQEKIDGLHILAEAPTWSSFSGRTCEAYLLISTQGTGSVPMPIPGKPKNVLKFGGEDVLGFCATNLGGGTPGATTTGFWEMVLDGSAEGLKKNNLDSLATNDDASVLYLTTQKEINLDQAFGGHSMVFGFDMETRRFSGPYVRVMDDLGIQPKVDGLHVSGELELP